MNLFIQVRSCFSRGCIIRAKTDSRSRTKNCSEQDPKYFPEQQPKFLTKFRRGSKTNDIVQKQIQKIGILRKWIQKNYNTQEEDPKYFLKFSVAIKHLYYMIILPSPVSLVEVDILELSGVFMSLCQNLPHQHMTGAKDGKGVRLEADTGND